MASPLTIPDAIEHLFGINVAKESPYLKNKATSMVRNELVKVVKEEKVQRSATYLADAQQLVVIHNALLLNAVFQDPKDVKKIFDDKPYRDECTAIIKQLFQTRNNLAGIALQSIQANELVAVLASDQCLYKTKLPNPFNQLPQLALGKNLGLLNILLAQSASISTTDSALLAYLSGDWFKASELLNALDVNVDGVSELSLLIQKHIKEAQEFDDLLDMFRPS